jgi:hypothetical protein
MAKQKTKQKTLTTATDGKDRDVPESSAPVEEEKVEDPEHESEVAKPAKKPSGVVLTEKSGGDEPKEVKAEAPPPVGDKLEQNSDMGNITPDAPDDGDGSLNTMMAKQASRIIRPLTIVAPIEAIVRESRTVHSSFEWRVIKSSDITASDTTTEKDLSRGGVVSLTGLNDGTQMECLFIASKFRDLFSKWKVLGGNPISSMKNVNPEDPEPGTEAMPSLDVLWDMAYMAMYLAETQTYIITHWKNGGLVEFNGKYADDSDGLPFLPIRKWTNLPLGMTGTIDAFRRSDGGGDWTAHKEQPIPGVAYNESFRPPCLAVEALLQSIFQTDYLASTRSEATWETLISSTLMENMAIRSQMRNVNYRKMAGIPQTSLVATYNLLVRSQSLFKKYVHAEAMALVSAMSAFHSLELQDVMKNIAQVGNAQANVEIATINALMNIMNTSSPRADINAILSSAPASGRITYVPDVPLAFNVDAILWFLGMIASAKGFMPYECGVMNQLATCIRWVSFMASRVMNNPPATWKVYKYWDPVVHDTVEANIGGDNCISPDTLRASHEIVTSIVPKGSGVPELDDLVEAIYSTQVTLRYSKPTGMRLQSVDADLNNGMEYVMAEANDVTASKMLTQGFESDRIREMQRVFTSFRSFLNCKKMAGAISYRELQAMNGYLTSISSYQRDRTKRMLYSIRQIHTAIQAQVCALPARVIIDGDEPSAAVLTVKGQLRGRWISENTIQYKKDNITRNNGKDASLSVFPLKGVSGLALLEALDAASSMMGHDTASRVVSRSLGIMRELSLILDRGYQVNKAITQNKLYVGNEPSQLDVLSYMTATTDRKLALINPADIKKGLLDDSVNIRSIVKVDHVIVRRNGKKTEPISNGSLKKIIYIGKAYNQMMEVSRDFIRDNMSMFGYCRGIQLGPLRRAQLLPAEVTFPKFGVDPTSDPLNKWKIKYYQDAQSRRGVSVKTSGKAGTGELIKFTWSAREAKEAVMDETLNQELRLLGPVPYRLEMAPTVVQDVDFRSLVGLGTSSVPVVTGIVGTPYYGQNIPKPFYLRNLEPLGDLTPPFFYKMRDNSEKGDIYSKPELQGQLFSLKEYTVETSVWVELITGPTK